MAEYSGEKRLIEKSCSDSRIKQRIGKNATQSRPAQERSHLDSGKGNSLTFCQDTKGRNREVIERGRQVTWGT